MEDTEDIYTELNEEFVTMIEEGSIFLAVQLYNNFQTIIDLHFDENYVFEYACYNNNLVLAKWLYETCKIEKMRKDMKFKNYKPHAVYIPTNVIDSTLLMVCNFGNLDMAIWLYSIGGNITYDMYENAIKDGLLDIAYWLYKIFKPLKPDMTMDKIIEKFNLKKYSKTFMGMCNDGVIKITNKLLCLLSKKNMTLFKWVLENNNVDMNVIKNAFNNVNTYAAKYLYEKYNIALSVKNIVRITSVTDKLSDVIKMSQDHPTEFKKMINKYLINSCKNDNESIVNWLLDNYNFCNDLFEYIFLKLLNKSDCGLLKTIGNIMCKNGIEDNAIGVAFMYNCVHHKGNNIVWFFGHKQLDNIKNMIDYGYEVACRSQNVKTVKIFLDHYDKYYAVIKDGIIYNFGVKVKEDFARACNNPDDMMCCLGIVKKYYSEKENDDCLICCCKSDYMIKLNCSHECCLDCLMKWFSDKKGGDNEVDAHMPVTMDDINKLDGYDEDTILRVLENEMVYEKLVDARMKGVEYDKSCMFCKNAIIWNKCRHMVDKKN